MRTSISAAAGAFVLALTASAQAASFSLVSGTIHAEASATAAEKLGGSTVNDLPADITLGPANIGGTINALAKTSTGDAIGSFSASGTFTTNNLDFSFGGYGQGHTPGGSPSAYSSGTGSIDLLFTLDAPTKVQFQASGTPFRLGVLWGPLQSLRERQTSCLKFRGKQFVYPDAVSRSL